MVMVLVIGALAVGFSLGLFGGGGSILTVPLLVYGAQVPPRAAIPMSLVLVGTTSMAATLRYGLQRLVDWRHGILFGLFGILGAALGARVYRILPGSVLLLLFGVLMVTLAALMFRPPLLSPCERIGLKKGICASVSGVAVGFLTALLGAGGGFLIVPALVLLLGVEMRRAVATSVFVITLNTLSALAFARPTFSSYPAWPWLAVLAAALVASWFGAHWAPRLPQQRLRQGFSVAVLLLGTGIILKQAVQIFAR